MGIDTQGGGHVGVTHLLGGGDYIDPRPGTSGHRRCAGASLGKVVDMLFAKGISSPTGKLRDEGGSR